MNINVEDATALRPSVRISTSSKTTAMNHEIINESQQPSIVSTGGEGIQVAIRMRPLNSKENTHNKVWKVLSKYNSITQTTNEGKPLPDRLTGRNFFTYDQIYDESTTTHQVYTGIAQPIVISTVCTGKNGTIFAYGQTSSGKTYTMQGAGSLVDGSSSITNNVDSSSTATGGIVHMAANDIFAQIASCPDRIFDVRVSFLEIYNEEVRDLLQDYNSQNKVLQIREDPRRGVFVESKEKIVTDAQSLLSVLWQGEKSRSFASTAMNERSSRSHTIFRITIESRSRNNGDDDDSNSQLDDNTVSGAVRVSTLNLVDLAGSESVRHTGATGDRQKEGGMINQSLLTLSRVIVALGTPNATHVNFRDSKLTRILQPSLSGNARMAVVCCATPSELYLEETRSTLLFASRAKMVKTNAQINEVMDDRSIIRKLQRELALLRSRQQLGGIGGKVDEQEWSINVERLESLALSAEQDAQIAKEKLQRMYQLILMNKDLDDSTVSSLLGAAADQCGVDKEIEEPIPQKRHRRRLSDGDLHQFVTSNFVMVTPLRLKKEIMNPSSVPTYLKKSEVNNIVDVNTLSPSDELIMLRGVVVSKKEKVKQMKRQIDQVLKQLQGKESELVAANCSNDLLRADRDEKSMLCYQLQSEIEDLKADLVSMKTKHHDLLTEKEAMIEEMSTQLNQQLDDRKILEETVDTLQDSNVLFEKEMNNRLKEKDNVITKLKEDLELCRNQALNQLNDYQQRYAEIELEKNDLHTKLESMTESLQTTEAIIGSITASNNELEEKCEENEKEIELITNKYTTANSKLIATCEALSEVTKLLEHEKEITTNLEQVRLEHEQSIHNLVSEKEVLMSDMSNANMEVLDLKNREGSMNEQIKSVTEERNNYQKEISRQHDLVGAAEIKLYGLLAVLSYNEKEKEELSKEVSSLRSEKMTAESLVKDQIASISDLENQLTKTMNDNLTISNHLTAMTEQCDQLSKALQTSEESLSILSNDNSNLKDLHTQLSKKFGEAETQFNDREKDLQHRLDKALEINLHIREKYLKCFYDASNKIEVLSVLLHRSDLDNESITATFGREIATTREQLLDQLNTIKMERDDAIQERMEVSENLRIAEKEIKESVLELKKNREELEHLSGAHALIEAELIESRHSALALNDEFMRIQSEVCSYKSEISKYAAQLQDLTIERDEAVKSVLDTRKQIAILEDKVQNLDCKSLEIEHFKREVGEIADEKKELEARLHSLTLNSNNLQYENKELKILLANANSGIDEARTATRDISKQLEEKSALLRTLESQMEGSKIEFENSMNLKLQNELQALIDEKENLQSQLNKYIHDRSLFESELKRRMSDEQRALIHEAEQTMRGLRARLESTERALKISEAEAYAAREMKVDLEDQYKRTLEMKVELEDQYKRALEQLNVQMSSLNEENSRLLRLVKSKDAEHESAMSAMKGLLEFSNKDIQEKDVRVYDMEQHLIRLQQEKDDMEKKIMSTKKKLEIATSQNLTTKNTLDLEVERLKKALAQKEEQSKENIFPVNKLKQLEVENDKLRQKLKSYVERCEKLNASKLTNEKLEAIKKVVAERAMFEKDLEAAKEEIQQLKTNLLMKSIDTLEDSEITTLRFNNEALESKLRKLAAQCQRLEDEKLRALQPLKSAKGVDYDGNIERSIVTLCDKVASLEEECNSLVKYKNLALSCQHELDKVQNQKTEFEAKVNSLMQHEAQYKNFISSLEGKVNNLKVELENTQDEFKSQREKVKFLERENLQLMTEAKTASQKIQNYKFELNRLQAQMSANTAFKIPKSSGNINKPLGATEPHKENAGSNILYQDEKVRTASVSKKQVLQSGSSVKDRQVSSDLKNAFAASEENTQECKQS